MKKRTKDISIETNSLDLILELSLLEYPQN